VVGLKRAGVLAALVIVADVGPLETTDADTLYSNFKVVRTEVEPGREYDQVKRGVRPLPLWLQFADD
jgi:hypothetical protein